MQREKDEADEYASPPCFLHEIDPSYAGLTVAPPPLPPDQVGRWRKTERERLIAERRAIASEKRWQWNACLIDHLRQTIGESRGAVISAYWPFRGEPDLRPLLAELTKAGARVALPVVVEKGKPLLFREWKQGDPLARGVWNIPYPAEGAEVRPDIVISPVVGFDRNAYRLGYGGGFYDRTLAQLGGSARPIGVGYSRAEIPTIHPQPHDIPMSVIVTEASIVRPST